MPCVFYLTFEQAKEDIRLSGDVAQLGEVAARIAINDGFSLYNSSKKYSKDISDDIYYPGNKREQSVFNRSMANKTSGLKEGETKRIIINTADTFYVVEADGYMSGNIELALPIDKNINRIKGITEEIRNADKQGENSDSWTENLRNARRGDNSGNAGNGYRAKAEGTYGLDGEKSKRDIRETLRASGKNYPKGKVSVALGIKVKNTDIAILKKIARSGNVAVVIENFSGADKDAKGFYSGGVIHLNAKKLSEGGFTYTGIHESVHFLKDANPEGYKSIEKFIKNYYKEKGVSLKSEIKLTQDFYAQKGQVLTPDEAMEEIVCNTLSDIATDEDALTAFMGLDGKAQNRFIEALKAIARKLKDWANKCLGNTEYHSVVINDADTLLSLAKQLRAELKKSGQKNNTAENSGVRYAFNENFGQQLRDWLEGKGKKYGTFNGEYFLLGTTPNILIKHGAPSVDFIVPEEVIAKVTGMKNDEAHVIAIEELAKLPAQMNDPILLFKGSIPNSFVALTEIVDKSGHDVIAIVHINKWHGRARVNKIVSAYSKTNQDGYNRIVSYVNNQINEGNLIDGNIKKAISWFTSKGLQLPKLVQTILTASNSISKNSEDVNKKSYSFGEEELHYTIYTKGTSAERKLLNKADRAMGTLLKLTQNSDVDYFEVNQVLHKALSKYGVPIKPIATDNMAAITAVNKRIFDILSIADNLKAVEDELQDTIKNTTLDGGSSDPKVDFSDVSSVASNIILQKTSYNVNRFVALF